MTDLSLRYKYSLPPASLPPAASLNSILTYLCRWRRLRRHGGQGLRRNRLRSPPRHAGAHRVEQLPQDLQLRPIDLPRSDGPRDRHRHRIRPPPLQGQPVPAPRGAAHRPADPGEPDQLDPVRETVRAVVRQPRAGGHKPDDGEAVHLRVRQHRVHRLRQGLHRQRHRQ